MQLAKEGERSIHAVQNTIFFKRLSIKIRINPSQEEGGGVRGGGGEREREGARRKRTFSTRFLAPPPPAPPLPPSLFMLRFLVAFCVSTRPTGHGAVAILATRNAGTSGFPRKEGERRVGRRRGVAVRSSSPFSGRIFAQLSSNLPGEETGQAKRKRERESRYQKCGNLRVGGGSHGKTKPKHTKKNIFFFFCHLFSRSLSLFSASLPSLHCAAATSAAAAAVGAAAAAAAADALLPPPPLTSSSPPETTLM